MRIKFLKESSTRSGYRKAVSFLLHKYTFGAVAVLLTVGLWAAGPPLAGTEPIVLRSEPMSFTPKEFYIVDVLDERADKKAVAYLLPAIASTAQAAKALPVDLQGGGHTAIRQFIRQSLRRDTKLRPVVVRLKEYKATEKPGANGRVDGQVMVNMAFELQRKGENVPLVEYSGGARYTRSAAQQMAIEPLLRQSLVEAVRYLNTWMDKEADRNEKLAKGIKVHFKEHTRNADDDTVFYSVDRPLAWSDFQGSSAKPSKYAATVFTSFGYEGNSEVKNGIIHVDLALKVYVLRGSSWVKAGASDAYSLNHEQRHFDITKLVAERFKQKIHPDSLTLEDYNSIIQYHFIESFREMNRLQDQYDGETQHGLNRIAQESWNNRIDAELRAFEVKK
ncbi:hypothetical protein [Pontibacter ruber]|uniref:DUF922 domain-containing protein n=1 Tax=Pontibacter ruber TaxID=1343895 RepID=A0ABW5CZQ4_9BACT|nr:hypothetical protein [Pontibacter ruber]